MAFEITIYGPSLVGGGRMVPTKTIKLDIPKADALKALAATRLGLPGDHGATLTDERGRSVKP